jgi:hypothetical protein
MLQPRYALALLFSLAVSGCGADHEPELRTKAHDVVGGELPEPRNGGLIPPDIAADGQGRQSEVDDFILNRYAEAGYRILDTTQFSIWGYFRLARSGYSARLRHEATAGRF